MKAIIILIALITFTISANAKTSQILRQSINPTHMDPDSFLGGVIEKNNDQIKLAIFLNAKKDNKTKELIIESIIIGSDTNDCNETTYYTEAKDGSNIILTDRSAQTCDDIVLFPVVVEYITTTKQHTFISKFEGSNFISLSNPTGRLKMGTTLILNYAPPAVIRVANSINNPVNTTVPKDTDDTENPVILPVIYEM